eukprot:6138328-Amphidinium_carterae.1
MAIKTSGKGIVVNNPSVWPFHMRGLSFLRSRRSQAFNDDLFSVRFRKLNSGPGLWPVSELRRNQKPE